MSLDDGALVNSREVRSKRITSQKNVLIRTLLCQAVYWGFGVFSLHGTGNSACGKEVGNNRCEPIQNLSQSKSEKRQIKWLKSQRGGRSGK